MTGTQVWCAWVSVAGFFPSKMLICYEVFVELLASFCTTWAAQGSWNYGDSLVHCHKQRSRCTTVLIATCHVS